MIFIIHIFKKNMALPKVSIIIVNYNGKIFLKKCLESLYNIDYDNFEVIVVDNNSTDDSIEFVTKNYPSINLIKLDSNMGFAHPNNLASKISNGEYLLFLNNDTIVTTDFLNLLIASAVNNVKNGAFQSLLLRSNGDIDSSGDFIDSLGVAYNSKTKITTKRKIFAARAACMLIKKSLFLKVGGFDEKFFFSFEDIDLGWRLWISGYENVIIPNSIVYHIGGSTVNLFKSESSFHGIKNQLSMKITNFEKKLVWKNIFLFFVNYGFREIKIWFDYKIHGTTNMKSTKYEDTIASNPNFLMVLKAIFWLLKNWKYLSRKHNKINSNRILSTKELEKLGVISNQKQ